MWRGLWRDLKYGYSFGLWACLAFGFGKDTLIHQLETRVLRPVLQLMINLEQLAQVEFVFRYGQQQHRPHVWKV